MTLASARGFRLVSEKRPFINRSATMVQTQTSKINIGEGILKPGTRPIQVYVDKDGEYWLCDADVNPDSPDFRREGCTSYSEVQMAEGG
jgi:hypothetical protein